MLDSVSRNILNSIKSGLLLEEEEAVEKVDNQKKSFKSGDEEYDTLKKELSSKLINTPLKIDYFNFSKDNNKNVTLIEVAGTIQESISFIYKYGGGSGVFISVNNFEMKDNTAESLRVLYIYYNTGFQKICKTLSEK
jgi:hypothetical protein